MKLLGALLFACFISQIRPYELDVSKKHLFPTKEECGLQNFDEALHNELPWTVFIPLQPRTYNPDANLRCAGVIISKRYILTSQSCLQFVLKNVRLGVYDTSKTQNSVAEIEVSERAPNMVKDITLLRLEKDIDFTKHIRPICLPFGDFKKSTTGDEVYAAGWGLVSHDGPASTVIKKIIQEVVSNEECGNQDEDIMCVKVQKDSPNLACGGDEGGPIMHSTENNQWVLDGILSNLYDITNKPCAINGPARGVRLTDSMLRWIVEQMHD